MYDVRHDIQIPCIRYVAINRLYLIFIIVMHECESCTMRKREAKEIDAIGALYYYAYYMDRTSGQCFSVISSWSLEVLVANQKLSRFATQLEERMEWKKEIILDVIDSRPTEDRMECKNEIMLDMRDGTMKTGCKD